MARSTITKSTKVVVCENIRKGNYKMDFLKKTKEIDKTINGLLEEKNNNFSTADDYDYLLKVCKILEKNAMKIRKFINKQVCKSSKESIQKHIGMFEIYESLSEYSVEEIGQIIQIKLPPLLHKKVFQEVKHSKSFCEDYYTFNLIDANLQAVLRRFVQENQIKPYDEKCLLYIKNIVDKTTPKAFIPDTDNHEYQVLINTIASVFLDDDSPDFVAHLHDTEVGDTDETVVYIIPYRKIKDVISETIALEKRKNFRLVA